MIKKLLIVCLSALLVLPVFAQDAPRVVVEDQFTDDGMVRIAEVVSDGPGFVVIHIDNGGAPGAIVGFRAVNDGLSENVDISIDLANATPRLFAMLHTDTGVVGEYEFGTVEGADGPVADADGNVITPAFNIASILVYDQFVADGMITVANVIVAEDGWLVIHGEGNPASAPGPVVAFAPVTAGVNNDIMIEVGADATANWLSPMLHLDNGVVGEYEFGTVEGADAPLFVNGTMGLTNFRTTQPSMSIHPQLVGTSVVFDSVFAIQNGWVVIHADNGEGAPGPVIGNAFIEAGTTVGLSVDIDAMGLTDVIFPMMHVDTGEAGVYEFGTVEGADGPVFVGESVLTFAVDAVASISTSATMSDDGAIVISYAVIDTQGWLVLHADNGEGAPGPVLDATPLVAGLNMDIVFDGINADDMTETVFPMLHVDTGEAGVYEFGTVEGADAPVFNADGAPVFVPVMPGM